MFDAVVAAYVPFKHTLQSSIASWAFSRELLSLKNVPFGHDLQDDAPLSSVYLPELQMLHAEALVPPVLP
jgi:hypothetical protein